MHENQREKNAAARARDFQANIVTLRFFIAFVFASF
jgi:hypothetical protein